MSLLLFCYLTFLYFTHCCIGESLDRTDAGSVISEKEETSVKCTFTLGKVSFCYVVIVCTSRDEAQHAASHRLHWKRIP